jgi:hypothetical protein
MNRQEWIVVGVAAVLVGCAALIYFRPFDVRKRPLTPRSPPAGILLEQLATAVDLYEVDMGRLPLRLQDLVEPETNSPRWLGPYFWGTIPADPWGHAVNYTVLPGNQFELRSLGPDGVERTEDDIIKSNRPSGGG